MEFRCCLGAAFSDKGLLVPVLAIIFAGDWENSWFLEYDLAIGTSGVN